MTYKYAYNPAAGDNITLHENGKPRGADTLRRQRRSEEDTSSSLSGGAGCCLGVLVLLTQIILHAVIALTLYWIIQFRWGPGDAKLPFSWRGEERGDLERQWNLHPLLMLLGFIYLTGQGMLVYRSCRCCRLLWGKLLHTLCHLAAIPAITLGFLAAWDYHALRKDKDTGLPAPTPHFYSIHSWLGLATMAVYILQFLVGFFSFVLLLCCEPSTAKFRASLTPIHSTVGTVTFLLAIATAVTGLTEKAFFELSIQYPGWVDYLGGSPVSQLPSLGAARPYSPATATQSLLLNSLSALLAALAILLPLSLATASRRQARHTTKHC